MIPHVIRSAALAMMVGGAVTASAVAANSSWRVRLVNGPSTVSLKAADSVPLNSPGIIEKGLCLSVKLARDAAYQCGDLMVTHALPYVRVLGKVQTPMLVYSSAQASPHPLISLDVAIPSGTTIPDDITYVVKVDGATADNSVVIPNALLNNSSSASRKRVQVGWNATSYATDVYPVMIDAVSHYPGGAPNQTASVSTEVIVVNRSNSPFGNGWWLAGVDKIYFPSRDTTMRLLVSGDGSARIFRKVTTNVWAADSLDRPDTLKYDAPTSTYERKHSGGARTQFNAFGQHRYTIDSRGFTTQIAYQSSSVNAPIASVTLPKMTAAYRFFYTDTLGHNVIDSALSPSIAASRLTRFEAFGSAVSQIFDPNGSDVYYEFDAQGRVILRRDRSGVVSHFRYDKYGQLYRSILDMDTSNDTTRVCGFFAVDTVYECGIRFNTAPGAVVSMDGPRPNSSSDPDTSAFRIARFGAPSWIRDAKLDTTNIARDSARLPAFVTGVRAADGTVSHFRPDSSGNVAQVTVDDALTAGVPQTTNYKWDLRWDKLKLEVGPLNDTTFLATYDVRGNVDSTGDGRSGGTTPQGVATRFEYASSGNGQYLLLRARRPLRNGVLQDYAYFEYDTLGNATTHNDYTDSSGTLLGANAVTTFVQDGIGRTVFSCVKLIDFTTGPSKCDSKIYDISGRDSVENSYGQAVTYGLTTTYPAQGTEVRKYYANEGQLLGLRRERTEGGYAMNRWVYDRAGRVIKEWTLAPFPLDSLPTDTLFHAYDRAGNLTQTITRSGDTISMRYDRMNRLRQKDVSGRTIANVTPDSSYGVAVGGAYPNQQAGSASSYTTPADTYIYTYDAMSRMLVAQNNRTIITRTYSRSGAMLTDEIIIPGENSMSFAFHRYRIANGYDAANRRTSLKFPLALSGGDSTIKFTYIKHSGELNTVTDPFTNAWDYDYNLAGQIDSLHSHGSVKQTLRYDAVGNVVHDSLRSSSLLLRSTAFTYDKRGKRLTAVDGTTYAETDTFRYSGMGHLVYSRIKQKSSDAHGGTASTSVTEGMLLDALGNDTLTGSIDTTQVWHPTGTSSSISYSSTRQTLDSVWRLKTVHDSASYGTGIFAGIRTYHYDKDGNVTFYLKRPNPYSDTLPREDRYSVYDAEGRLRAADYRSGVGVALLPNMVFEEFSYDALGRRYRVKTRKQCSVIAYCALSTLRRTVWDGDRELMEIQLPLRFPNQGDQAFSVLDDDHHVSSEPLILGVDYNPYFGRVLYLPGLVLDQPIGFIRYNYTDLIDSLGHADALLTMPAASMSMLWDQKGRPSLVWCTTGVERCAGARSNGHASSQVVNILEQFYMKDRSRFQLQSWQGTILEDKRDATRTNYRRNRYYDPASGRFTQEDPIGLAGGLNLYGYADGDPANFSDPFGLCPDGDRFCEFYNAMSAQRSAINQMVGTLGAMGVAGGVGAAGEISGAAIATLGIQFAPGVQPGTPVYRVFGGSSPQMGNFWTTINPETVTNYASKAGLPAGNAATDLVAGLLRSPFGVKATTAAPGAMGPGGIIELQIRNPAWNVMAPRVSPFIPK